MLYTRMGLPFPENTWKGEVHSVFEHSANIALEGENRLLNLNSFSYITLPGSLYVEGLRTEYLKQGDEVVWDGKILSVVSGKRLYFEPAPDCKGISTELTACEKRDFELEPYRVLLKERRREAAAGSDMEKCIYDRLESCIENLFAGLKQSDIPFLEAAVKGCVGLGMGLTPSGDDMLCGILAVLACYDRAAYGLVCEAVKKVWSRTNDISRSYLSWACAGFGSDLAVKTARAMGSSHERDCVRLLLRVGHTSGADILTGMIAAAGYEKMR